MLVQSPGFSIFNWQSSAARSGREVTIYRHFQLGFVRDHHREKLPPPLDPFSLQPREQPQYRSLKERNILSQQKKAERNHPKIPAPAKTRGHPRRLAATRAEHAPSATMAS